MNRMGWVTRVRRWCVYIAPAFSTGAVVPLAVRRDSRAAAVVLFALALALLAAGWGAFAEPEPPPREAPHRPRAS
jgi:hypothetical protein